jgi:His/Glu/Gln/Arg/opine family amino acid ABC transporter permease subunit
MTFKQLTAVAALVAGFGLAGTAPEASADVMETISERGTLVVGIRADYRPYGYLDSDGNHVGIEPELARDVAERLGVDYEFVPVVASNRMEFLQQGRIDLLIATMTDTEERRRAVNIVEPNYYSSGTNILAPKEVGFSEWEDLRGRPICGIQGAFYNRKTQEEFGAEIVAFTGTAEVLTALQQGSCQAFVYDDSFIVARLQEDEWADYEMPLETIDDAPWGLAVQHGEDNFYEFMSDTVADWHRTGKIIELRRSTASSPSPLPGGCTRNTRTSKPLSGAVAEKLLPPSLPPDRGSPRVRRCQRCDPDFCARSGGLEYVYEWFRQLYLDHGINLTIVYDGFDRRRMLSGVWMTIRLSVICLVLSVVIGIVGAWLQGSRLGCSPSLVQFYVQFFRNTPPLVQLYFFFFAIGSLLPRVRNEFGFMEPMIGNVTWAIIALSFFAGAFNVEIFRSGIEAVPKSTVEAAESLGYSRWQTYQYVVLPLAVRICLPALNNNLVNLVKTTTLAYAIAVPEMLYVANQIWSDAVNVPEMMTFLLIAYVALVSALVWVMHRWERSLRLPGFGQ